jgi:predicted unusual protein kinase regulating ubiquinone biosynthesis (AarF/ABC1/UbiB family)
MVKTDSSYGLTHIKSGSLSRGLSLATLGLRAGMRLGSYSLTSWWRDPRERQAQQQRMLLDQARLLAAELGQLKGSVMKVGQMLALYGDYLLLPPEVVAVLRTLQEDSPPLAWAAIRPVLERELGDRLHELEVDPEPLAAASLGQVHRARRRDGRELCIKIQYPGVAESVDSDLDTLETLLLFSRLLPSGFGPTEMMTEIRAMLHREVDYHGELATLRQVRELLQHDHRFRVPEVFPDYSTGRVLTTSYEPGLTVDGTDARALPQHQRNALGAAALELFLKEFFGWNLVQTDPNFGNYRIRPDGPDGVQLVLLDFGAVRQFPEPFRLAYQEMVRGAFWRDQARLWRAAMDLQFMPASAPRSARERFAELCFLIIEPFTDPAGLANDEAGPRNAAGDYCWGVSDLPQRVALAASRASLSFAFRVPPKEFVFLHRKLGGVFMFLAELQAELNAHPLLLPYMGGADGAH